MRTYSRKVHLGELAVMIARGRVVGPCRLFRCGEEPEIRRPRSIESDLRLPLAARSVPPDALEPARVVARLASIRHVLGLGRGPQVGASAVQSVTVTVVNLEMQPQIGSEDLSM